MNLAEVKAALIAAHRSQDWNRAAELSQIKEKIKRQMPGRCACGRTIYRKASSCRLCWVRKHYYPGALPV